MIIEIQWYRFRDDRRQITLLGARKWIFADFTKMMRGAAPEYSVLFPSQKSIQKWPKIVSESPQKMF